jgi:hypothetical protein
LLQNASCILCLQQTVASTASAVAACIIFCSNCWVAGAAGAGVLHARCNTYRTCRSGQQYSSYKGLMHPLMILQQILQLAAGRC